MTARSSTSWPRAAERTFPSVARAGRTALGAVLASLLAAALAGCSLLPLGRPAPAQQPGASASTTAGTSFDPPAAIGDYRLISAATAWPVVLASGSLDRPERFGSGDAWTKALGQADARDYEQDSAAPASRPEGAAPVDIHFYGRRTAGGELVPNGSHDDLLEVDVYRLRPMPWNPAAAHDYTAYVMASQVKYDGASFVHPVSETAFSTYDMFFATTPMGFVEGGLQLDSQTDTAKAEGEALMKAALQSFTG